ncbi:hypothetical protein CUR178_01270 [Leishmania enriettii]|uniref:Protein FAM184A/B N-terminal domain-containing protein n=1 Tax=Leishmania enriettii TaxID=5663 RepID=A0A836GLC3_LEIEN|nr:hypothetical protein CUR178_01270 [Leishmania enriettii]
MPRNISVSFAAEEDDKHYKMCKKIAQLTKVIYILNNRSEDNEQRTEWLHQTHVQEIAQLCQEYESQVERLQQQVADCKADQVHILASLEKSQKEQLQSAQEDFKARLVALSQQVSEQESKYDSVLREEKHRMAAEVAAETKRVRDSKDLELANVVREYNEKYKDMLAEQLDSRDALEKALEREWGSRVEELQAELAAAQGHMNAQLQSKSKLLQEALQRCATLSSEKDQSVASLDEAHLQLKTLQRQLGRTEEELAAERRRRATADVVESELETKVASLESKQDAFLKERAEIQQSLATERALNARQAAELQALENEKASLSTAKEALVQELEDCTAALTACKAHRDAAESQLRDLHSSSAAHASSVSELASQLGMAKQRIALLEEAAAEAQHKYLEEAAQAQQRLEGALHQAAEAARVSQAKHEEELRSARASLTSNWSSEQQKTMEAHMKATEELTRQHEMEVRQLRAELAAARELLQSTSKQVDGATVEVSALRAQCAEQDALLRKHSEESAKERLGLEQQLQQLQSTMEAARRDGVESAAAQSAALERLQAEHAAACAAADAAHARALREAEERSAAQLGNVSREHARLVNAMQEQHTTAMQRAKEDSAAQAISLSRDVDTRLAAQQRGHAEQLATMRSAAVATEEQLRARISELQAQLQAALSEKSALQASSSEALQQQKANLEQLQAAMAKAQADAAAALDRALRDADMQRRDDVNALEAMRQKQVSAERQRYENAVSAHKEEVALMEASAGKCMAAMEARLQKTVATFEEMRAKDVKELEERLTSVHQLQVREQTAMHSAERLQLQSTIDAADAKLKELISSVTSKTETLDVLTAQRDGLLENLAEAKRDGEAAIVAERNRRAADLEQLRVAHQKELNALGATHKGIVDDFVRQQGEERRAHQALVDQLRGVVEELQYKYSYRESRSEDVELINKLLQDVQDKELALNKAHKDMRMYKLELINREENYNKIFGRHPSVADHSGAAHTAAKSPSSLPGISATRKQSSR